MKSKTSLYIYMFFNIMHNIIKNIIHIMNSTPIGVAIVFMNTIIKIG